MFHYFLPQWSLSLLMGHYKSLLSEKSPFYLSFPDFSAGYLCSWEWRKNKLNGSWKLTTGSNQTRGREALVLSRSPLQTESYCSRGINRRLYLGSPSNWYFQYISAICWVHTGYWLSCLHVTSFNHHNNERRGLWTMDYDQPHFPDGETEAQRDKGACPGHGAIMLHSPASKSVHTPTKQAAVHPWCICSAESLGPQRSSPRSHKGSQSIPHPNVTWE